MSSLATILASPASGVSEAVAGYPIGRGDGVNSVFTVPSEITAVSSLYRRDWQGTVALSQSARTNSCGRSNPLLADLSGASATVTQGNITDHGLSNGITFPVAAQDDFAFKAVTVSVGQKIAASFFVKMTDGGLPVVGPESGKDFSIYIGSKEQPAGLCAVKDLGSGLYKILYYTGSLATQSGAAFGPQRSGKHSGRGFTITGYHIEINSSGDTVGSYIPTTTAPVTVTDYAATGNTITLAEAPAFAAELTVDGTGVNLPLLQIGGY